LAEYFSVKIYTTTKAMQLRYMIYLIFKVIRPVKRYIESAKIEAETIIDIISKDVNREANCVLMIDYFYFEDQNNRYIALVFERLGKSLYDFIKMNNHKG